VNVNKHLKREEAEIVGARATGWAFRCCCQAGRAGEEAMRGSGWWINGSGRASVSEERRVLARFWWLAKA